MRHKKRDIIIDILLVLNILLTAITCWGFYKLYDTLEYVSKQAPIEYIETDDGKINAILPSGRILSFCFGEKSVKIQDCSIATGRNDAVSAVTFIKSYANKNDIQIPRSTLELIGEYRIHAILCSIDYKLDHTRDADLDYIDDPRWYMGISARLIGIVGL